MPTVIKSAIDIAKSHINHVTLIATDYPSNSKGHKLSDIKKQKALIETNLRVAQMSLENLLPIEKGSEENLRDLVRLSKFALQTIKPRSFNYPILSQKVLTLRDEEDLPRLVLAPIFQEGPVSIKVTKNRNDDEYKWYYQPLSDSYDEYDQYLKNVITYGYHTAAFALSRQCPRNSTLTLSMSLNDLLIPATTRKKIQDAKEYFGDNIFILLEAKGWEINVVKHPDPDPLVVGFQDGLFFLIDEFDLTNLERMVAAEFTTPQLPSGK